MRKLLNEVIDGQGQSYKTFVEFEKSSLPNHYELRFFSTFSGAKDPLAEQTKWKATLPRNSFLEMISVFRDGTLQPYTENNGQIVINPDAIGIRNK